MYFCFLWSSSTSMEPGLLKLLLRSCFSLSVERTAMAWKYLYPDGKRGARLVCMSLCTTAVCLGGEELYGTVLYLFLDIVSSSHLFVLMLVWCCRHVPWSGGCRLHCLQWRSQVIRFSLLHQPRWDKWVPDCHLECGKCSPGLWHVCNEPDWSKCVTVCWFSTDGKNQLVTDFQDGWSDWPVK